MTKLVLEFQQALNEIEAFRHLANTFIAAPCREVLRRHQAYLNTYRTQPTFDPIDWVISDQDPLRTIVSKGAYEKGGKRKPYILAEITAKWRIEKITPSKKGPVEHFRLVGIASTRVRLLSCNEDGEDRQELSMWRMEIGDSQSPGCYFHTQILGESADRPFPSSVPVPRLPGLMITPVSVAEFVMAELFQDEWSQHAASHSPHLARWSSIQRKRLSELLKWKLRIVESGGSPWTTLKHQRPDERLFAPQT